MVVANLKGSIGLNYKWGVTNQAENRTNLTASLHGVSAVKLVRIP